jgi:hypothetical protein
VRDREVNPRRSMIQCKLADHDEKKTLYFMFGIQCVRCDHEIIAPQKSEFLDDKVIRHLWHCPRCHARFESFPRFPASARLVKEVMVKVDVFPPLNGT